MWVRLFLEVGLLALLLLLVVFCLTPSPRLPYTVIYGPCVKKIWWNKKEGGRAVLLSRTNDDDRHRPALIPPYGAEYQNKRHQKNENLLLL